MTEDQSSLVMQILARIEAAVNDTRTMTHDTRVLLAGHQERLKSLEVSEVVQDDLLRKHSTSISRMLAWFLILGTIATIVGSSILSLAQK